MRGPALAYVPYGELDGRPSVVVDGSPAEGTVLCLSHWPGIDSPAALWADLSAQMAFLYAEDFDRHAPAEAVSNNHFDQDGLVSVFALARPDEARPRRDRLIDVAGAGDFATFTDRDAARVSMGIAACTDPERSLVADLNADYDTMSAQLYVELLGRLAELCDRPDRYRDLWAEEDATLTASEEALAHGAVVIEERPDLDLAVVTVADGSPVAGGHRFAGAWSPGVHPMAINNATDRVTVLTIRGRRYDVAYRYETWVQYRSRRPRPRADLGPLAERLNDEESGPGQWTAERVSGLTPTLALDGAEESGIDAGRFRRMVEDHLRDAPGVWDPYTPRR